MQVKLRRSFQPSDKGHGLASGQDGEPYLELIPHQKERKRRPGRFKGKIKISGDFTETPADVTGSFYGETESNRVHFNEMVEKCDNLLPH